MMAAYRGIARPAASLRCFGASLLLAAGTSAAAPPQAGVLCGTVVDRETAEPLSGAFVTLEGTRLGAAAAEDGSWCVGAVPAGGHRVVVQMIGYEPRVLRDVSAVAGDTTRVEARLQSHSIELAPVTVTGRADRDLAEELSTSIHTVRPAQVVRMPGAGEDLFRAVHALPGVVARADFGTQFYVRGGTPDQNLIVVDGVTVFNPYRLKLLGGPVSMFNPDVVERVELLPGGFGAEYGDKLSAVLVVDNREGDRTRRHYRAGASLIDGRVLVEGPTPGTQGDGSWILSSRRTWYDQFFNHLDELPKGTALPFFRDAQLKVVHDLGPRQQLIVNAIDSREGTVLKELDVEEESDDEDDEFFGGVDEFNLETRIDGRLLGVTWMNAVSDRTLSRLTLSHFDDDWFFRVDADDQFLSLGIDMRKLEVREDLFHTRSADHVWQGGLSVTDFITDVTVQVRQDSAGYYDDNPEDRRDDDGDLVERGFRFQDASTATALYVQDEILRWAPVTSVRAGLRLDHDTFSDEWKWSPRLSLTRLLSTTVALRAGWGHYYQAPNFASLFERFERQIEWNLFETIRLRPERAVHYLAGLEWRPGQSPWAVKLEGYYKSLDDLVVETDSTASYVPDNSGRGYARGVEGFVQKRPLASSRTSGWVSYTWGITEERDDDEALHPRDFDQRHTLNVVGSLRLGRGWSVESRYAYGSGFPWTPVEVDAAGAPRFDDDGRVIWGPTNSRRFRHYSRWDLRVTWDDGDAERAASGEGVHWQCYLEIMNLTGRKNVYDDTWNDDYSKRGLSYMLPTLPFFGVRLDW
jgi:hypothetical protein